MISFAKTFDGVRTDRVLDLANSKQKTFSSMEIVQNYLTNGFSTVFACKDSKSCVFYYV